jgi:hypothetical protein
MKETKLRRELTLVLREPRAASEAPSTTGGASGSGGPPGERNGQYRHGERTKGAIAEQRKFSALQKMLRAGLRRHVKT